MKFTCEYCGNYLSDTDENCPTCGAPNSHLVRAASGVPRTIGELKAFAAKHNLPLDKMRFFLGEDCREARAFGIYQEPDGDFVVYKNKSDGSRAVRYQGKDEAYAVNELYQKMKAEIINQKQHQAANKQQTTRQTPNRTQPESQYRYSKKPKKPGTPFWIALVIVILFASCCVWVGGLPDKGYYTYNGGYYYSDVDHWYAYDEADDTWYLTDVDDELDQHYQDYYDGADYSDYYGYSDFADSEYYHEYHSSGGSSSYDDNDSGWSSWDDDDDWDDDDWDWDSGSDWDSGYSDWDSDW